MNTYQVKRKTKNAGKTGGTVHQDAAGGSLHVSGVSPTSIRPLNSFYSAGPILNLGAPVQRKLTIGQPNDRYEREADRVAEQVMRMPEKKESLVNGHSSLVQRQSECPEKEGIQTKPIAEQITPLVQRQPLEEEEYNPDEKITRLSTNGRIHKWALRDKNNNLQYDDNNKGIYIPIGIRVVKLEINPDNNNYRHVVLWYNGKYREGYISKDAFINSAQNGNSHNYSPFAAEVFLNDAWLAVKLCEKIMENFINDLSLNDFFDLVNGVKSSLKKIESGKIELNDEILSRVKTEVESEIQTVVNDKVETMQRISELIFSILNPQTRRQDGTTINFSDETLIIPLSQQWLDSLPEEWLSSLVLKEKWEYFRGAFSGSSGEGVSVSSENDYFIPYKNILLDLKDKISRNLGDYISSTPESEWILGLTSNLENVRRMIFIHDDTIFDENGMWAEFVPVDQSLGPIKSNRVMSVLIHEMNVNSLNFLPDDTHGSDDYSEGLWKQAAAGGVGEILTSAQNTADLFQLNPYISIIYLAYYLKKIEKMGQE